MESLILYGYQPNATEPGQEVALGIVNTLTKTEIEAHAEDFVTGLLNTYESMDAYVLIKQLEIGVSKVVSMLKDKATAAYSQRFDARGGRIGSAKIEYVNNKPTVKYTLDEETQRKINENTEIMAGLAAQNEELQRQAIESGRATKTEEPNNRGGLRITFDK